MQQMQCCKVRWGMWGKGLREQRARRGRGHGQEGYKNEDADQVDETWKSSVGNWAIRHLLAGWSEWSVMKAATCSCHAALSAGTCSASLIVLGSTHNCTCPTLVSERWFAAR
jgi:hypothetical protein